MIYDNHGAANATTYEYTHKHTHIYSNGALNMPTNVNQPRHEKRKRD